MTITSLAIGSFSNYFVLSNVILQPTKYQLVIDREPKITSLILNAKRYILISSLGIRFMYSQNGVNEVSADTTDNQSVYYKSIITWQIDINSWIESDWRFWRLAGVA